MWEKVTGTVIRGSAVTLHIIVTAESQYDINVITHNLTHQARCKKKTEMTLLRHVYYQYTNTTETVQLCDRFLVLTQALRLTDS